MDGWGKWVSTKVEETSIGSRGTWLAAATRAIRQRLKLSDLVLKSAMPIPLSSANEDLQPMLSGKRRVIALNKQDLANRNLMHGWISYFNSCKQECLPINAHSRSSVQKLLDLVEFKLKEVMTREPTLLAMVLGVPNVGKSALINSIHQIALSRFTGEDELEWGLCLVLLKILLDSGLEIFNNIKGQILLLLLVP
ncbi:PREDICTED: short integuments 2, mitochondrial-like isoform X2 [Nicotiana attenuata]|uniref:short integuments 2, mitochondrial-like isoform X2 n=1 Tax=Nicotiana attenuata TaxID=49451 RepID=UPI0009047E4A|nr:PREDICTED: short integuments 2, mitochondrial-like isoform X2 [Nicotiana attenuata]